MSIYIKSEGCEDPAAVSPVSGCGDATRIRVNGRNKIVAKRGYNVVVVNGDSGMESLQNSGQFA